MEESNETPRDWWDDLSEHQKQHIQRGLDAKKAGCLVLKSAKQAFLRSIGTFGDNRNCSRM
jgi:hypothetical protein